MTDSTALYVSVNNDDGWPSESYKAQYESERICRGKLCEAVGVKDKCLPLSEYISAWFNDDRLLHVCRGSVLRYCNRYLEGMLDRQNYAQEGSRPWMVYWCIHTYELLENENLKKEVSNRAVEFLKFIQHPEGGFRGGGGHMAHLATTYAAVMGLVIIGTEEALSVVNRVSLYNFLYRRRKYNKDGRFIGFELHENGEIDVRSSYLALAVASILEIVTDQLCDGVGDYVCSLQSYDGGIGGVELSESHAGYTYCGFAAALMMGQNNKINMERLLDWVVKRQMSVEGGFNGRPNKLVDSCYSFWNSATLALIHEAYRQTMCGGTVSKDVDAHILDPDCLNKSEFLLWYSPSALMAYILGSCHPPLANSHKNDGFCDKPDKPCDAYHTCYSLSGLGICELLRSSIDDPSVNEHCFTKLPSLGVYPTDPFYNVRCDKVCLAHDYVSQSPILIKDIIEDFVDDGLPSVAREGDGARIFREHLYAKKGKP